MLHSSPFAALPALFAAVMLAAGAVGAAPASPAMARLCNGGSAPIPGQPAQPGKADCDTACHSGCGRRKARL
jgi:hypothetical protein